MFFFAVNTETYLKSNINTILKYFLKFTFLLNSQKKRKQLKSTIMNNIFRGLLAGYGAKKLGGGCFGTVLVFIIIWVLLGQCS